MQSQKEHGQRAISMNTHMQESAIQPDAKP
uniref:Uncharacterized protein n=1 Tax=Rhizophora mucronata TaxID=61149 RepID=A0A2P2Q700_RHIMU